MILSEVLVGVQVWTNSAGLDKLCHPALRAARVYCNASDRQYPFTLLLVQQNSSNSGDSL